MKTKTADIAGRALDWAVCKAQGIEYVERFCVDAAGQEHEATNPSTNWAHGGPIIEREHISTYPDPCDDMPEIKWSADSPDVYRCGGPTPLVAAMRCFVASRLGDEVDIPEELT